MASALHKYVALHDAAEAAERDGLPLAAISAYQRAMHLMPADAVAALNLGTLLRYRGGLKASRCCCQHAPAHTSRAALDQVVRARCRSRSSKRSTPAVSERSAP